MPSLINSDDGVVSGTSGLKTTGGNDGITVFQQNGTESARITSGGNAALGTSSPSSSYIARYLQISNATSAGVVFSGPRKFSAYSSASSSFVIIDDDASGATRLGIDSSGNLSFNSGYGSAATAYGCRAWVNFNGTGTVAIRASGNVSSITDLGIGIYEVNMTVGMPDTNYSGIGSNGTDSASGILEVSSINKSLAVQRVYSKNGSTNGVVDQALISVAIFR